MLLLIIQLSLALIVFYNTFLINESAQSGWESSSHSTRTLLQNNFNCCGFANSSDQAAFPCPQGIPENTSEYGCEVAFQDFIYRFVKPGIGIMFAIVSVEFFALVFSLSLAFMSKDIHESEQSKRYF